MIPSSYLFKNIYHQHWEEPDAVVAKPNHRFTGGLLRPLATAITTRFRRPTRAHALYLAGHAYE